MSPTPTPTKSRREIVRELDALADVDGAPTVAVDLDPEHADELRELNETDDPDAEMSLELAAAIRWADLDRLGAETDR